MPAELLLLWLTDLYFYFGIQIYKSRLSSRLAPGPQVWTKGDSIGTNINNASCARQETHLWNCFPTHTKHMFYSHSVNTYKGVNKITYCQALLAICHPLVSTTFLIFSRRALRIASTKCPCQLESVVLYFWCDSRHWETSNEVKHPHKNVIELTEIRVRMCPKIGKHQSPQLFRFGFRTLWITIFWFFQVFDAHGYPHIWKQCKESFQMVNAWIPWYCLCWSWRLTGEQR